MQARYYDPLLGRFLSIDPVGFSPNAPGMFSRYAYTLNDPVNMTDPTGEEPGDRFETEEEAVDDFFDFAEEQEKGDGRNKNERGADFKQDQETGEYFYDDVQEGDDNEVDMTVSKDTTAVAHTHLKGGDDRANEKLSPGDRKQMKKLNKYTGNKANAYLRIPSGERKKWDGDSGYRGRGKECGSDEKEDEKND
jgi:uncharacterized protein RhaS with RHS repeats